jgi:hypothetical protein
MPLSMYQASVPVFIQLLGGVASILDKAEAHCADHKIDESVLLQMRVFPDMFHMAMQTKTTLFHSGGAVARLIGQDVPNYFGAEEASFADLKRQVAETLEFMQSVKPDQLDGSETRDIEIKLSARTFKFSGQIFLFHFAMPQLCFHAATAYDILRSAGVDVGKRNFVGEIPS